MGLFPPWYDTFVILVKQLGVSGQACSLGLQMGLCGEEWFCRGNEGGGVGLSQLQNDAQDRFLHHSLVPAPLRRDACMPVTSPWSMRRGA